MRLSLGFSTCPNDTFIFDAIVHQKIDTEGLEFDVTFADVEELNKKAFVGDLSITKLSYHAYAYIYKQYQLLDSGSALGRNNGPLLIAKEQYSTDQLKDLKIGIPGKFTTANLLLTTAFPEINTVEELLFSDIEDAILSGRIDAGLIIHENRFTYASRGLMKIVDLGEYWEKSTGCPIPLGGIVVRRDIPEEVKAKIQRVLRRSVDFAMENPLESVQFMQKYAQEMTEEIMAKHVDLYVNDFSVSLGVQGRRAIEILYDRAYSLNIIPELPVDIFA